MRTGAVAALIAIAAACGRGEPIYAGSDVPIETRAVVDPEPPVAGRSAEPAPMNVPMGGEASESGPPPMRDGAAVRDDAGGPDAAAPPTELDAAVDAAPDAAPPIDAGGACAAGRGDCDGDPGNGCEVDLDSSLEHCGACDRICHADASGVDAAECVAGACRLTCQFAPILGDCDGNPDNGCETDLWHDPDNCSVCGMECSRCADGVCR